ncbi:uncharacterized protein LOC142636359 [Castanea sativa]|uniref:uncharacterized protein LOC142636359 n=1 Tax=Castanea sativa TaxID=21020 RepID=UPI003F64CF57
MDPLVQFLKEGTLLDEKGEADKVRRKAPCFWLSKEQRLYKRSFSGPYLLCVHPEAVEPLLEELHEGIYGSRTEGRFVLNIHQLGGVLNPLSSPWPFAQWDLDIVGPFPRAVENQRWLLVGTNYFTKWVKVEPLSNIRDLDAKKNKYSTPAYPQGNVQTEAINKIIVNELKKRLDKAMGRWVEELPHILWTYRTTLCQLTGETTFSMTYGTKAVISLETGFPTLRTSMFTPNNNDMLLERSLGLVDERREAAIVQLAYYQQKLKRGYDTKVRERPLTLGDLVLRKVVGTAKKPSWRKLGPNWEGPYRITSIAGIGAYFLEDLDENVIPCS